MEDRKGLACPGGGHSWGRRGGADWHWVGPISQSTIHLCGTEKSEDKGDQVPQNMRKGQGGVNAQSHLAPDGTFA